MTKQPNKRKKYSDEFKAYLVQEAINSERSIASIARENGINQNLLHNWKYQNKKAQIAISTLTTQQNPPSFIPVILETQQNQPNYAQDSSLTTPEQPTAPATLGDIQLQIPSRIAPINLHIAHIETQSLIELLRGLQ